MVAYAARETLRKSPKDCITDNGEKNGIKNYSAHTWCSVAAIASNQLGNQPMTSARPSNWTLSYTRTCPRDNKWYGNARWYTRKPQATERTDALVEHTCMSTDAIISVCLTRNHFTSPFFTLTSSKNKNKPFKLQARSFYTKTTYSFCIAIPMTRLTT